MSDQANTLVALALSIAALCCDSYEPTPLEREAFEHGSHRAPIACAREAARRSAACGHDVPTCVSSTGRPFLIACLHGARERSRRAVDELCETNFEDESYTGWVGVKCAEWSVEIAPCATLLMELPTACRSVVQAEE